MFYSSLARVIWKSEFLMVVVFFQVEFLMINVAIIDYFVIRIKEEEDGVPHAFVLQTI